MAELGRNGGVADNPRAQGREELSFTSPPLSRLRGDLPFEVLLLLNAIFSLTDLITSFVALQGGLIEGNPLLLGVSLATGMSILESLAVMKVLFVAVCASLALIGIRSTKKSTRSVVLGFLLASTLIFLIVSASNIRSIVA